MQGTESGWVWVPAPGTEGCVMTVWEGKGCELGGGLESVVCLCVCVCVQPHVPAYLRQGLGFAMLSPRAHKGHGSDLARSVHSEPEAQDRPHPSLDSCTVEWPELEQLLVPCCMPSQSWPVGGVWRLVSPVLGAGAQESPESDFLPALPPLISTCRRENGSAAGPVLSTPCQSPTQVCTSGVGEGAGRWFGARH